MKVATVQLDAEQSSPGATPRSDAYALVSLAYAFPEAPLLARVRDGQWADEVASVLSRLPYRLGASGFNWTAPSTLEELQTEYIRLFQIGGRRGPPCPLHGGHFAADRAQELRRLISFYNYFGFRVTECTMPDHISVQLEFMSELAGESQDQHDYLRAQRDFLNRLAWCQELPQRLRPVRPAPFYRSLAALTERFITLEKQHVHLALTGG